MKIFSQISALIFEGTMNISAASEVTVTKNICGTHTRRLSEQTGIHCGLAEGELLPERRANGYAVKGP